MTTADSTAPEAVINSPPAKRIKTAATMDAPPALQIKKLSEKGRLPTRGSAFAAGYDLYAAKDTIIPGRGKTLVSTDISMAVPAGTCRLQLLLLTVQITDECLCRWSHRPPIRPRLQALH